MRTDDLIRELAQSKLTLQVDVNDTKADLVISQGKRMTDLRHSFDHDLLSRYLSDHIDGFDGLDDITRFTGGQSNPTYKITSKGRSFVMRAKPPGRLLKSAHAVDREYRVMRALSETNVPVPKMLHLSDDDSPLGTMFFVMEMLDGRIFWDPALPQLLRADRARIFHSMSQTMAALHNVIPADVDLADYGPPGNYFERQVSRWTKQYRAAEISPVAEVDWLIDWLPDNIPNDDGQISIVHGDFRLDNLMFDTEAPTVQAILDWELSTLGNPMADLAYQCMGLRLPNSGVARGLMGEDRRSLGIPLEEEYVASYCDHRGIKPPDDWPFYIAFSYFRLLAILQGVIRRAVDGNASNPGDMDTMRAAVPMLAVAAQAVAREGR